MKTVVLTLDEGFQVNGKLIDVSLSGAGIALDVRPAIGLGVIVGKTPARVVRHFADGIAVQFEPADSAGAFRREHHSLIMTGPQMAA